jgi:hypothetical protein
VTSCDIFNIKILEIRYCQVIKLFNNIFNDLLSYNYQLITPYDLNTEVKLLKDKIINLEEIIKMHTKVLFIKISLFVL